MNEIEIPTIASDEEFLPLYASEGAAGADIKACIQDCVWIEPCASALIPSGLRFAIPAGYELQVRPRSGLALKNLITVLNTPGTIDSDYRGEVGVILINHGKDPFKVTPGMRIAQVVLAKVERASFCPQTFLLFTPRGEGGFGHTGTH
jgi:dUTP pyrophosphatase